MAYQERIAQIVYSSVTGIGIWYGGDIISRIRSWKIILRSQILHFHRETRDIIISLGKTMLKKEKMQWAIFFRTYFICVKFTVVRYQSEGWGKDKVLSKFLRLFVITYCRFNFREKYELPFIKVWTVLIVSCCSYFIVQTMQIFLPLVFVVKSSDLFTRTVYRW